MPIIGRFSNISCRTVPVVAAHRDCPAFARDGSLLMFDEPSANLDARAESDLFRRFRELARSKTTLLISHRFSTVSMADRILVLMNDGTICEQGTHAQLLALNRHYAQSYRLHQKDNRLTSQ